MHLLHLLYFKIIINTKLHNLIHHSPVLHTQNSLSLIYLTIQLHQYIFYKSVRHLKSCLVILSQLIKYNIINNTHTTYSYYLISFIKIPPYKSVFSLNLLIFYYNQIFFTTHNINQKAVLHN